MQQQVNPQSTLNGYIYQAIVNNSSREALTDLHGNSYTYGRTGEFIAETHMFFEAIGLRKGDHVAICASNSAEWSLMFLATVTYGAVAVSILADFRAEDVAALVRHSESRLLVVDGKVWRGLSVHADALGKTECVLELGDDARPVVVWQADESGDPAAVLARTSARFRELHKGGFDPRGLRLAEVAADDVVVINYTSGSTGSPKGVMLTERNMWSNVQYSIDGLQFLMPGDNMLSMLPLAHMFGLTVDLLHPFVKGCHIYFLMHTPSPAVLMTAFQQVRPKLVVSVPLVIEKIIRKKVFPVIQKNPMKTLLHVPVVSGILHRKLRQRLIDAFGGRLQQLILGGAGVSADVEAFLRLIRFPFTVGYGMTECGPLVGYAAWDEQRPGTCGHIVDRMQLRVDSPDPARVPGVMWVRGDNVMAGYYHNPQATEAVMGPDGWMNTGDIGTVGSDGLISLRGRDKNMILGPSGQNIYPEEIEQKLNNVAPVAESVVIDAGQGRICALVYPDQDAVAHLPADRVEAMVADAVKAVNATLPAYSQIRTYRLMDHEFEKTPKRSIKRYLYTAADAAK